MRYKDVEGYIEVPVPGKLQVPAYQLSVQTNEHLPRQTQTITVPVHHPFQASDYKSTITHFVCVLESLILSLSM